MPAFLDGFATQFSRLAGPPRRDPAWLLYLKHLSPPSARFVGAAGAWPAPRSCSGGRETRAALDAGLRLRGRVFLRSVVATRRCSRATRCRCCRSLCLFCVGRGVRGARCALARVPALAGRAARQLITAVRCAAVLLRRGQRARWAGSTCSGAPTRARWRRMADGGTRRAARALAVENNGPTYLDAAGFRVARHASCCSITASTGTARAWTTW